MGIYADQEARLYADLSSKATPVVADSIQVWDSADSNQPKRITLSNLPAQAGADSSAIHNNVDGEIAAVALKAAPVASDEILIEDSAASFAKKSATLGSIPIAQSQVAAVPAEVASDGAAEITTATNAILLAGTTSGAKGITETSNYAGQRVEIRLEAASGGSYTLPVQGGTLTIDAAEECPVIYRNAANTAWLVLNLNGATIV